MKNKTDRNMRRVRKTFLKCFYTHNKLRLALAVFAVVMLALGNLCVSWQMQQLIDAASGVPGTLSLLGIGIIALCTVGALVLMMALDWYARPAFIRRAMRRYKDFAFEEMMKKSIGSFNSENTSVYISALTNDAISIETNYISKIFTLIMDCIMFVGAFAMMLAYSPLLTLASVLLSLFPVAAAVITGGRLAAQETRVSDSNESFVGSVKDTLNGFSVIKSFKAEVEMIRQFAMSNRNVENSKCARRRTEVLIQTIGLLAGIIAQFGVFFLGAYLAISGRGVTAGVVIVFVQLMNYVISPISEVPQILANRKAAFALIDKLAGAIYTNESREGKDVGDSLERAIELRSLSFAYEADEPVLRDISYTFEAGRSYALVGASGSGKSTLLSLLMGGREDYEGQILYDDEELRAISSESLFDIVSIVQQNVFVFNSSIKDNLTLYKDFDEKRVAEAARMAGLDTLMRERTENYLCGENGSVLSGGERQRLSIARCLLRGTPVLLVDEATAALDKATAFSVSNAILDIPSLTRIVVTHSLEEALMKKYDAILVLRNGRIEESGRFDDLMRAKGYFYSLFTVSQQA